MRKEIIIIIVIAVAIIITDALTMKYTKNNFLEINKKLDEIKQLGIILNNQHEEQNMQQDYEKNKQELNTMLENMQNEWKRINRVTAFYIEHDELEKVNSSIAKFKTYFDLEEYGEAIPELEDCKYILSHIEEKSAMQIINLF